MTKKVLVTSLLLSSSVLFAGCSFTTGHHHRHIGHDHEVTHPPHSGEHGMDHEGHEYDHHGKDHHSAVEPANIDDKDVAVALNQNIHFNFDSAKIDDFQMVELEKLAEFLVNNPSTKVVLEGHSDKQGDPNYNVSLSKHRAMNVSKFLVDKGVSDSQISTKSFGSEHPVSFEESESSFAQNRRVEVILEPVSELS